MTALPPHPLRRGAAIDQALWARVIRQALCADGNLDPDLWFPVSAEPESARYEAAAAIAICTACPVRAECLVLSLRNWTIGQHGVWGGLIAAERASLRRRILGDSRMLANTNSPGCMESRKSVARS